MKMLSFKTIDQNVACYKFIMKEKGLLAFPSCYKLISAIIYLNAK